MISASLLDELSGSPRFAPGLVHKRHIPAKDPRYGPSPAALDLRLIEVLKKRGVQSLYIHQSRAVEASLSGRDTVIVTPTASGKTLCYNLPVLQAILEDPESRALYLFPTKALSQDQLAELHEITDILGEDIKSYTFDGDTPSNVRRTVRMAAHIVVTNPDMLHAGVLPHHTKWVKLFENLKYVVIDEIHQYRGVFGSHLANVLRRLDRVCRFYGSNPRSVTCSATTANPKELADSLTNRDLVEIAENGAPQGDRHLWLYNPPVVNQEMGVRRSAIKESAALAVDLIRRDIQTIVFGRGRMQVEVLLTYIREGLQKHHKNPKSVRGYRGGYLPLQRREIERGLRSREYLGVVSTNALELGIDIGGMDACIVTGFPGSIASVMQQWGRAGRRQTTSLAVLVGTSNPLDQYLMDHPEMLLGAAPESGIIHPDNLVIRVNQIKCAAFELPFESHEGFGLDEDETLPEVLQFLEEHRILRRVGDRWHWMSDVYPAQEVSLRTASAENFVIFDLDNKNKALGEIDYFSAPFMIHEQAIYIHEGRIYIIEKLDWDNRIAHARTAKVDYYTDAEGKSDVKVLEEFMQSDTSCGTRSFGEVAVTTLPVLFKKIRFHTHENLGWGKITLPALELQTTSYWLTLDPDALAARFLQEGGASQGPHPKGIESGVGSQVQSDTTSDPENPLISSADLASSADPGSGEWLARPRRLRGHVHELISAGLRSLANVLGHVVPLYVLCDPRDLRVVAQIQSPFTQRPTLFVYDTYPGGVGLAERVYASHLKILAACQERISNCLCSFGCPSCVGPPMAVGEHGKSTALRILDELTRPISPARAADSSTDERVSAEIKTTL